MDNIIKDVPMLDPKQVLEFVKAWRYEDALGVDIDAPINQVDKAVILLSRKYGNNIEVKQSLNKAAAQLRAERNKPHKIGERCRNVGIQLSRDEKKNASLPYLREAVKLCGEWVDYHWLGSTLVQAGNPRDALPFLEKAVSMHGGKDDYGWLQRAKQALVPKTPQTVTMASPSDFQHLASLLGRDPNDPYAMQQMLDIFKNDLHSSIKKHGGLAQRDFGISTGLLGDKTLYSPRGPLNWLVNIYCWFRYVAENKVVKVTGIVLLVLAALWVMGWLSRR
jgi:hypothetical protein